MAPLLASKRYVSAAYDDKYFPEKNVAIPFKWESTPGRPKRDDAEGHHANNGSEVDNAANVHAKEASQDIREQHREAQLSMQPNGTPAVSKMYPLPPPPKLCAPSPLRVKDLLLHSDKRDCYLYDSIDDGKPLSSHDKDYPLHAYHHHRFPAWLSVIPFRPLRASTVVPIHKNFCILKPQNKLAKDRASPFHVVGHTGCPTVPSLQGRSQSFSYATKTYSDERPLMACDRAEVPQGVPERRCNSFNSLSATHHTILEHIDEYVNEDHESESTMATAAAAAMWAGACMLAAAASGHHDHNEPCRVMATKLKDLMQESANFSELELTKAIAKVCGGGGLPVSAEKRTKSMEEEVVETLLEEGLQKSCDVEAHRELIENENGGADVEPTHSHNSHKKRKSLFWLFKSECIACWCPSPLY